jgi:hypothetical protein
MELLLLVNWPGGHILQHSGKSAAAGSVWLPSGGLAKSMAGNMRCA